MPKGVGVQVPSLAKGFMSEFFNQTFYGNTILDWSITLVLIVASVIIGKVIYWIFGSIIKKLTSKTQTKLDDIIIDMIEEPASFIIAVIGMRLSLNFLIIPPGFAVWEAKIFQMVVVITIAWLLSRLIDSLFEEYVIPLSKKSNTDLDDMVVPIVRKGTKFIIWSMGIVVGLNNAGYDVGALLAGLGIGGLALAMAAKDTVSNMFGGFTIFVDKPFKINDKIKIKGIEGNVREIGLRSTRLETPEGRVVTMPNASFADNPVENISLEPSRKIVLTLKLSVKTPYEKVKKAIELLNQITKNNENVEDTCIVNFASIEDIHLALVFIYFIKKDKNIAEAQTGINLEILKEFESNKIEFAHSKIYADN